MRFLLCIALFVLLGTGAYAEDKKLECGKTVEECQTKVDFLNSSVALLQKQLQVYKALLTEANDRVVAQTAR